jgi:hypothetical protein
MEPLESDCVREDTNICAEKTLIETLTHRAINFLRINLKLTLTVLLISTAHRAKLNIPNGSVARFALVLIDKVFLGGLTEVTDERSDIRELLHHFKSGHFAATNLKVRYNPFDGDIPKIWETTNNWR